MSVVSHISASQKPLEVTVPQIQLVDHFVYVQDTRRNDPSQDMEVLLTVLTPDKYHHHAHCP